MGDGCWPVTVRRVQAPSRSHRNTVEPPSHRPVVLCTAAAQRRRRRCVRHTAPLAAGLRHSGSKSSTTEATGHVRPSNTNLRLSRGPVPWSRISPSVAPFPSPPSPRDGSLGCSLFTASGSTLPRHLLRGTAGSLSVQEPAQRFSCSRRLSFAESPIIYPSTEDYFIFQIKEIGVGKDTPSMCTLPLPRSLWAEARRVSERCGLRRGCAAALRHSTKREIKRNGARFRPSNNTLKTRTNSEYK